MSPIYHMAFLYDLTIRALYGRAYAARYATVAELIAPGSEVLDVCCGTAAVYWRELRARHVRYTGLDLNPRFVRRLQRRGIAAAIWDLRQDRALPQADFVIMQGSLFHFGHAAARVVGRMIEAARQQVVVAEPVRNLASSRVPGVPWLAARLTDPGTGPQRTRLTEATLADALRAHTERLTARFETCHGREQVCVFQGSAGRRARSLDLAGAGK